MTKPLQEGKAFKGGRNQVPKQSRPQAPNAQPKAGIKYCNRCEWNTESRAADIPEGMTADDMMSCPNCGQDLYEVDDEGNRIRRGGM